MKAMCVLIGRIPIYTPCQPRHEPSEFDGEAATKTVRVDGHDGLWLATGARISTFIVFNV